MPSTTSPVLDAILEGWQDYQKQLVVVLRPLTPEQFTSRAAPHLRTAGEIAAHLIAGRASWFCDVLKEGGDEMAVIAHWDDVGQPARSAAECVHGLKATWKVMMDALARWTPEEVTESIVLPWIGPKYPITRAWVVWHVLEHDLHHGGELSHTLGMFGPEIKLPPPPPEQ